MKWQERWYQIMQEASFFEKQDPVTVNTVDGVKQYVICLDEREEMHTIGLEEKTEFKQYVYKFNMFKDNSVDEEDVKANPQNYLEYMPKTVETIVQTTLEKRVKTLEQRQDDADQALQDLICTVMGE